MGIIYPKKFGLINANIIQEAQSIIRPITTFVISAFHWPAVPELPPLPAIITPPAMIIMREMTRIRENAILMSALINVGKAVSCVTCVAPLLVDDSSPIIIHLPIKGTLVLSTTPPPHLHVQKS